MTIEFIEWKPTDDGETIEYSFAESKIGRVLIANTSRGVCFLGFSSRGDDSVRQDMMRRFPRHRFAERESGLQRLALEYCNEGGGSVLPLHLRGTHFQIEVWKRLTLIPKGKLSSYGALSTEIHGNSRGARAVGSAVGANPVSCIVPCHRVVRSDGRLGGYHWGVEVKERILLIEN